MAMRTILLPILLLVAITATGQTATHGTASDGACALRPIAAHTEGGHIRVEWAAPACELAAVHVFRRRQNVGEEAEIHPVVVFGTHNDTTFVQCWDTLFTELGIYEYRAIGVDSAGTEGQSSAWIVGTNLHAELRPWLSSIRATGVPGERAIRLRWTLHNPERVRAIVIHRADRFDGPYEHLADVPPTDTTYLDRVQRVKETYFYRIGAFDVVGRSTLSMPVQGLSDAEPVVAPPSVVLAEAGPDGITLRWPGGGPDVAHFQVERGAPDGSGFILVADGIRATAEGEVTWTDSNATDNAVRSYRVRAVSIGGPVSGPSEVVTVQAADRRMPGAPTEVAARWLDDRTVAISWRDPMGAPVATLRAMVQRADAGSDAFTALHQKALDPGTSVFLDSTAVPGRAYIYRVVGQTLDGRTGAPSLPVTVEARAADLSGPRLLTAHRQDNGIQLEWADRPWNGQGLNLYRAVDDGEPKLLKALPVDASSYTDTAPVKGALNRYVLRLVLPDGSESEPSTTVSLRW